MASQKVKQLQADNEALREIAADLHWMARRYADNSQTYATDMLNQRTRQLLRMGVKLNAGADRIIWARDLMGRGFDGLTEAEATPGTPEAKGEVSDERG
jgi:alkylhydroperoxidase/carboxymuconolactone decarboxylase family protein YurZ